MAIPSFSFLSLQATGPGACFCPAQLSWTTLSPTHLCTCPARKFLPFLWVFGLNPVTSEMEHPVGT